MSHWQTLYDETAPVYLHALIRDTGTMSCGPMSYKMAVESMKKWQEYCVALLEKSPLAQDIGNKRYGFEFFDGKGGTVPQSMCFVKDIVALYVIQIDTSREELIEKQKKLFDKAEQSFDDLNEGDSWKRGKLEESDDWEDEKEDDS
jgi:hypothetical protein